MEYPAIPLLRIYLKEMKPVYKRDTNIPMITTDYSQ
jgi:hypothetical protein